MTRVQGFTAALASAAALAFASATAFTSALALASAAAAALTCTQENARVLFYSKFCFTARALDFTSAHV